MPVVQITETFAVSPQITPDDITGLKKAGFVAVINNRPDGESLHQPDGQDIALAAQENDLSYTALPVSGGLDLETIQRFQSACDEANGSVLAFCASGTRSLIVWSIGAVLAGHISKTDVVPLGAQHGYDLSGAVAWLTYHGH